MESGSRAANMVLVSGKACKVILISESGRKGLSKAMEFINGKTVIDTRVNGLTV